MIDVSKSFWLRFTQPCIYSHQFRFASSDLFIAFLMYYMNNYNYSLFLLGMVQQSR